MQNPRWILHSLSEKSVNTNKPKAKKADLPTWSSSVLYRGTIGCWVLSSGPTTLSLMYTPDLFCPNVSLASLLRTSHGGRDVFTDITVLTSVSANKLDGCPHPHFMKGGTGTGKGSENTPRLCTSIRPGPAGSFHDTEACPKGEHVYSLPCLCSCTRPLPHPPKQRASVGVSNQCFYQTLCSEGGMCCWLPGGRSDA